MAIGGISYGIGIKAAGGINGVGRILMKGIVMPAGVSEK